MAKVEIGIEVDMCPERVYEITQDYTVRYEWDPFPEKIELLDNAKEIDVGTSVLVVAKSGLKMTVVFVQLKPPNVAAIKMTKGPKILKSFAGSWLFKGLPNGNTFVTFKYTLSVKPWAFPKVMNRILGWYFYRKVRARLDGLAVYCKHIKAR